MIPRPEAIGAPSDHDPECHVDPEAYRRVTAADLVIQTLAASEAALPDEARELAAGMNEPTPGPDGGGRSGTSDTAGPVGDDDGQESAPRVGAPHRPPDRAGRMDRQTTPARRVKQAIVAVFLRVPLPVSLGLARVVRDGWSRFPEA